MRRKPHSEDPGRSWDDVLTLLVYKRPWANSDDQFQVLLGLKDTRTPRSVLPFLYIHLGYSQASVRTNSPYFV